MKHTKGPWDYERLFRDAGNHPGDHYTVDDDFLTIIIVEDDFDPEKHDWAEVYGPNQEANAELIAKAPEMYDQLTSARAIMQRFVDKVDSGLARSTETYAEMKLSAWIKRSFVYDAGKGTYTSTTKGYFNIVVGVAQLEADIESIRRGYWEAQKHIDELEAENEALRENWGKRSAKPRRLRATVRHFLLALDTNDKEKRSQEEEKLRQYSGYAGWPHANPVSRNTEEETT